MVKKLLGFYQRLLHHPAPLVFGLLFISAKVWSNVTYGGTLVNGLRSGLIGIFVYALALGLIHLLSEKPLGERLGAQKLDPEKAKRGAVLTVVVYLFILCSIVDRLQRQGYMPGYPVLSWIPGWTLWHDLFNDFPGGYMVANIVRNLPFFVLIPAFVLHKLGVKRGEYGFSGGEWKPAIPFLLIYTAAFLFSGLTAERWLFLLYAVLYSGFQEEFFYRGVMQPLFTAATKKPVWGIGLSVGLFALLHIPDFVFRVYPTVPMALSGVASTALFGGLMAYGVYRTGILWPWVLIHALSNVVGF
ncbi:MAG: CPBP family intramembrane glutamic endopeptidase [Bacillota bacterium]|jgi:membrane protease YdiL (CAAX protease family)